VGDGTRVRRLLLTLLGNAIKFTERGHVWLQVAARDGALYFEVGDTGPGLAAEHRARLFQRFEQADGARTSARYGGSGLGLAISQELAAAMSGRIDVDSAPGEGSRFTLRLPLRSAALRVSASTATPGAAAPGARSLALLLVEDDPLVAEVVAGLLRARGHRVSHVAHALAALTELAMERFDVALFDLDLPGMDGLALARELRAQGQTLPLVAITARADAQARPQAMAAGFDGFVRKPVTHAMLSELLASCTTASPPVRSAPHTAPGPS